MLIVAMLARWDVGLLWAAVRLLDASCWSRVVDSIRIDRHTLKHCSWHCLATCSLQPAALSFLSTRLSSLLHSHSSLTFNFPLLLSTALLSLLSSMSRAELTDADIPLQYQLTDDMHTATAPSHSKPVSIDRRRDRYPFCLVWGPLPLISSAPHHPTHLTPHLISASQRCWLTLCWLRCWLCVRWLLPFIGHMGICDSEGKVHDFAGPYHIGVRHSTAPLPHNTHSNRSHSLGHVH